MASCFAFCMLASASAVVTVSCFALLLHLQMVCFSIGNCYCFLLSTFVLALLHAFASALYLLLAVYQLCFWLLLQHLNILTSVLMNSTDIVPCGCFQCLARTPTSRFLSHTCPWIQNQFKINLVSSPFQSWCLEPSFCLCSCSNSWSDFGLFIFHNKGMVAWKIVLPSSDKFVSCCLSRFQVINSG